MERSEHGRRDFLKILGVGSGAAVLGNVLPTFAVTKEIYPADRITWINPIKPGGGLDLIARSISIYLGKHLKEASKGAKGGEATVKNVTEAGGARAYSLLFNAKPDGYTIGDFITAYATENIGAKPDVDYTKYTYLVRTGISSHVLMVHKNSPIKSWEDMMKAGQEKELKWAVGNFGRTVHTIGILVKETARVPVRLINFPGSMESINALMRGDVNMAIVSDQSASAMLNAGEARALTDLSENSQYPGVPSIAQLGYPELGNSLLLHRLVIGPPNLPKEIVNILTAGFKRVFNDKEFLEQVKKINFVPDPLYGTDAERQAQKLFKFYEEKTPILKKYLT